MVIKIATCWRMRRSWTCSYLQLPNIYRLCLDLLELSHGSLFEIFALILQGIIRRKEQFVRLSLG